MTFPNPIAAALWRMTPNADDVPGMAEYFAQQEDDCACLGYVLGSYLAELTLLLQSVHATECQQRRCHTCAAIATGILAVHGYNHLHAKNLPTGEDT